MRARRLGRPASSPGVCFILPAMLIVAAPRLGLRALRHAARRPARLLVRRQAGHHRHRAAGAVEPGADGGADAGRCALLGLPPRSAASLLGVNELADPVRAPACSSRRWRARAAARSPARRSPPLALPARPPRRRSPRRSACRALFLVFLKIGSVLFGSGYVLLAFLRADLVERLHWLTEGAAPRRRRGRPGHARAGVHDRDLHRLPARRAAPARWSRRPGSSCPRSSSSR